MQVNVKCQSCNTDSSFFIAKDVFLGPFRCRQCKNLFTLKVRNGEIESCEPLAAEVFEKTKTDRAAARKKKKEKTA
jgi:hypothetical protein